MKPGNRLCLLALLLATTVEAAEPADRHEVRLLSFNAWGLGAHTGSDIGESIAVLRAADADIIGLQESRAWPEDCALDTCEELSQGRLQVLAETLGYHVHENTSPGSVLSAAGAILSRFPIVDTLGDGLGVAIDIDGRRVRAWNVHPTDFPYQPYQLLKIEYGGQPFLSTADTAIAAARRARGNAVPLLLQAIGDSPESSLDIVFGDFNEPSHRDWSPRAVAAGKQPMVVAFPQSRAMESAGFIDAYRAFFPNEITHPGFTWTPFTSPEDPSDHHDRIDFIFLRGTRFEITGAALIGEASPAADIVVTPWPSDHRAVLAVIRLD